MASELTISAALSFDDGTDTEQLSVDGLLASPSSLKPSRVRQSIATSETALKLGDTTAPGYVLIINRDSTNYVDVKVAASGAIFARLDAGGGCCLVKLGSGAQAPVLVANTTACLVEALVIPA